MEAEGGGGRRRGPKHLPLCSLMPKVPCCQSCFFKFYLILFLFVSVCVCVCVRACVRACVRVCVCEKTDHTVPCLLITLFGESVAATWHTLTPVRSGPLSVEAQEAFLYEHRELNHKTWAN